MWACPSCGRSFASRNQSHACAALGDLDRRIDSPRFLRIDTFSPRNVVHVFRLSRPDEVDTEFAAWLAEAYRVGAQEHLRR